jgi:hypothetical protein
VTRIPVAKNDRLYQCSPAEFVNVIERGACQYEGDTIVAKMRGCDQIGSIRSD